MNLLSNTQQNVTIDAGRGLYFYPLNLQYFKLCSTVPPKGPFGDLTVNFIFRDIASRIANFDIPSQSIFTNRKSFEKKYHCALHWSKVSKWQGIFALFFFPKIWLFTFGLGCKIEEWVFGFWPSCLFIQSWCCHRGGWKDGRDKDASFPNALSSAFEVF